MTSPPWALIKLSTLFFNSASQIAIDSIFLDVWSRYTLGMAFFGFLGVGSRAKLAGRKTPQTRDETSSWIPRPKPPYPCGVRFDVGPIHLVAVPELSTWAMMLLGFAGLGFAGYRQRHKLAGARSSKDVPKRAWPWERAAGLAHWPAPR